MRFLADQDVWKVTIHIFTFNCKHMWSKSLMKMIIRKLIKINIGAIIIIFIAILLTFIFNIFKAHQLDIKMERHFCSSSNEMPVQKNDKTDYLIECFKKHYLGHSIKEINSKFYALQECKLLWQEIYNYQEKKIMKIDSNGKIFYRNIISEKSGNAKTKILRVENWNCKNNFLPIFGLEREIILCHDMNLNLSFIADI